MEMTTMDHFLLIILSAFVAYLPRFIPLRIFASREIPEWFNEWMKYVPVSLFSALVFKDLFINSRFQFVGVDNVTKLIAAVIVFAIAYRTRSMGLSVVLGLCAIMLLSLVL
ncbi:MULTISPECIES: AzlD domain-containing protein [Dellaglioa]|uniref:Integral membrane protein n=3 Tax=Dellaglioa TaxID=2767880 RepID=A0A0R1HFV3_9LACO|nr:MULTISPECIES: AzlD domain-containing protein [Dellaglioa]KRK45228.1 integral membrane protein [Dellaglioa algida DSM 15638]MCZ2491244.1 AzlD domain-containing protein [Dellaglioa carnosa]MCZ2492771.1 AzlD domain-containing protein [Dellaglioa carnosa]MCZ2494322.1 AzlD domain-containing protein [Dellaglioa carnosa]MDK1716170.1 AzlD domain-containing protein [Dellaglioa algida]